MKLSQRERISRIGMRPDELELAELLREVAARGGPDVQRDRGSGWPAAWFELSAAALRSDMTQRGLLVTHSVELSAGKEVHTVSAGEYVGTGGRVLDATAAAWVAAGEALEWGTAGARELQLTRQVESLEGQLSHFRWLAHSLTVTMMDVVGIARRLVQSPRDASELNRAENEVKRAREDLQR